MFGWLRKRQEKELLKLVSQNFRASSYLLTYYTDVDPQPQFQELLNQIQEQARSLLILGRRIKNMPSNEVRGWLDINKDLRRIYEDAHSNFLHLGYQKSFDDNFKPLLGWDRYLEEHFE